MGKCCKEKKSKDGAEKQSPGAKPLNEGAKAPVAQGAPVSHAPAFSAGHTLMEAAIAAGILVFLPIVLNKVAPNALRSIRDGFDLATKSGK